MCGNTIPCAETKCINGGCNRDWWRWIWMMSFCGNPCFYVPLPPIMNRYAHTFVGTLLVIVMLMGLHFLPRIEVGGMTLRNVNILSDLFPPFEHYVNGAESEVSWPVDSTALAVVDANPCPDGVTCIEDYGFGMQNSMDAFYAKLLQAGTADRPVRIAYFGDSFVEGDILTADLRDMLQEEYGGQGVGFVEIASQTAGFRQSVRAQSRNFTLYNIGDSGFHKSAMYLNERYSVPEGGDASVTFSGTSYGKHTASARRATLFVTTEQPLMVTSVLNKTRRQTHNLAGREGLQTVSVEGDIRSVQWAVQTDSLAKGLLFHGVALDGLQGVTLDNFSLRGSSGLSLSGISPAHMQEFASKRTYDLIVLHYGLNVASPKSKSYDGYARGMAAVVDHLRAAFPEAAVLVVSVSDRDNRDASGQVTTMPGIRSLVAVQQKLAMDKCVAFWNLFEAMGGEASMARLVDATPSMANKDYTHLKFNGGKHLAGMLFDAIKAGADQYQSREHHGNK